MRVVAVKWEDIPLQNKLFTNVEESVLRNGNAAIENAFINEAGGHTKFPGLKLFATLSGNLPVYLHEWKQDLIAVTAGRFYKLNPLGAAKDVTGVPITGGLRVTFDRTDDELVAAAGADIIRLGAGTTELLTPDGTSPQSTHVGYIDSFLVAVERYSGRFWNSEATAFRSWNGLDVFSADGKPDDINAFMVTPFRELILTGIDSTEQFERLINGNVPFFRRWSVGEGCWAPYTLISEDNAIWFVNKRFEFVRASGQTSTPASDDIATDLETIMTPPSSYSFSPISVDNWEGAWATSLNIQGQKLILLQIPNAINPYGTRGVTGILDYRAHRWSNLYGWDTAAGLPTRWPGWSYYAMWGRHFVGGNGVIYELDSNSYDNAGTVQRMLGRTAHIDKWGESTVSNVQLRVKRGLANSNNARSVIALRAIKDNKTATRWKEKELGRFGETSMVIDFGGMGTARTWQFEYRLTDAAQGEVVHMRAAVEPIGSW